MVVDMPISRMGADDEGILSIPFRKRYLFHLPVVLSVIIRNRKLKSYTSWLDNKMEINIPTINPDDKIMGIDILGLDPMGYIIQTTCSWILLYYHVVALTVVNTVSAFLLLGVVF